MHITITTLYASLLGLLLIFLSYRTVVARRRQQVDLGVGDGPLARAARAHGNFTEYVPLALLLLLMLEQATTAYWLVHLMGAMLLIGRCLHAWGFVSKVGPSFGRVVGTLLTWVMIVICALLNLYLLYVFESVTRSFN